MPAVLVTASYDHSIRYWEPATGQPIKTIAPDPAFLAVRLAITPTRDTLAAGGNPQIRFFDIAGAKKEFTMQYDGHTANVTALAFNRDGSWLASSSEDGTLKVWDVRAPGCQREHVNAGKVAVNAAALHPTQTALLFGDQAGVVRAWDLRADKIAAAVTPVPGGDVAVRSLAVGGDGAHTVVANNKGTCFVYAFDLAAASEAARTAAATPTTTASAAAADADAAALATSSSTEGVVRSRWFRKLVAFDAHPQHSVLKCTVTFDARMLVTTSSDKTAKIWSLADVLKVPPAQARPSPTPSPAPSPAPPSSSSPSSSSSPPSKLTSSQNIANGASSAAAASGTLYNPAATPTRTIAGHQRWVWDCAVSADSKFVVTCSSDNSARLWNIATGDCPRTYSGHQKAVTCVALHDAYE